MMICPNCACELSADAKFCVKCGGSFDGGTTLPATTAPPGLSLQAAEGTVSSTLPAPKAPPYAVFVSQVMGLALCLSVVAFIAADNLEHGYWRISPATVISSIVAIVFMLRMPRTWRRIESGADIGLQRKLLHRSIFFVLLFVATATMVGVAIGKSGRETGQMVADFGEMSRTGKRISQARNSVDPTVPANLAMYKAIEADVDDFDAVLGRLHDELAIYDEKFPDQHEQTAKSIQSIAVGLKRASLLKQQVTVARDIESLDPAPRLQAWQDRMQPLLEAEDALDKH